MKKNLFTLLLMIPIVGAAVVEPAKDHFFYAGVIGGYANVDWSPVVSTDNATLPTDPTSAEGDGALVGVDVGYQLNPYVQFEAEYMRMPTSTLTYSIASHRDYGPLSSASTMDFWSVLVKFIAPLGDTGLSVLTEAGPGYEQRADNVADVNAFTPTFGAGFLYRINPQIQVEAVFQYAAGTGVSEVNPMNDYVPEIYAYTFKVDYLFL